ncbi:MAG: hypothetical protein AAGA25_17335 [Planctomycetota bacterium]
MFGLPADSACPECGQTIAESLPEHRTGPAWQNTLAPASWLNTAWSIFARPGKTYRHMRLNGPAMPARLFLLSMAVLVGMGWGVFCLLVVGYSGLMSWGAGMVAAKTVLIMTYIETIGVTFFSGRRGWRVPFSLAERVTCYASVGWLVAAVVLAPLLFWYEAGGFERSVVKIVGHWEPEYRWFLAALGFGAAVLFFETRVWSGVRQVRFGNRPSEPNQA